jgi:hypothetical protein
MPEQEIIIGVSMDSRLLDAKFQRGSLEGLATGLRDVLWRHPLIFDDADPLTVYVGGNKRNSEEPLLEIQGEVEQYLTRLEIPPFIQQKLETVRAANLPRSQYSYWPCDCEEYCDQPHGEGRLELEIRRPTFHELMRALKKRK